MQLASFLCLDAYRFTATHDRAGYTVTAVPKNPGPGKKGYVVCAADLEAASKELYTMLGVPVQK